MERNLGLNQQERLEKKARTLPAKIERVASKTLEYYLGGVVPFNIINRVAGQTIEKVLPSYDSNEMGLLLQEKGTGPNLKLIKRSLKRGGLFGAYEAFWSTWNPTAQKSLAEVYDAVGGDKRPITATMSTFAYSGVFIHASHPYLLSLYGYEFLRHQSLNIPEVTAGITAAYLAVGLPVAIKKGLKEYWKKRNKKNLQV